MQKCPYCWEKIQDLAKKCRFCWEWLEEKKTKSKIKTERIQLHRPKAQIKAEGEVKHKKSNDWLFLQICNNFFSSNFNANEAILTAFRSSIISIALTFIFIASWSIAGSNLWDILLMSLLTLGLYKRNRVCAMALFLFFLLGKINQINHWTLSWAGIIIWLVFLSMFFMGIKWTLRYHVETGNVTLDTREIVAILILFPILILLGIWFFAS